MDNVLRLKIRDLRKEKGFPQSYMAKKLGISQRAYSKVERGDTKLNMDYISRISLILQKDILGQIYNNTDGLNTYEEDKLSRQFKFFKLLIDKYEHKVQELQKEILELKGSKE